MDRNSLIITLVKERPGITIVQIAKELGISRGSAENALMSIEYSGEVFFSEGENCDIYLYNV